MRGRSKILIVGGVLVVVPMLAYILLFDREKTGSAEDITIVSDGIDIKAPKQKEASEDVSSKFIQESIGEPPRTDSKAYNIYQQYISAAELGDSSAKYLVSVALSKCRRGTRPSSSYFDRLEVQPGMTEEAIKELRQNFEQCSKLYGQYEGQDLHVIRDAWIESAADDGHPFALITQALSHDSVLPDSEKMLEYLHRALELSQGNDLLKESVIDLILKYHGKLAYEKSIDMSNAQQLSQVQQNWLAWEILYCKTSDECTENQVIDRLKQRYLEQQILAIVETANRFGTLVDQGNWKELNLPNY